MLSLRRVTEHPLIRQQGKYLVVSAGCTILDFGLANIFAFGVGLDNVLANAVAFTLVAVANFVLNRGWVFGRRGKVGFAREVVPFVVVGFVAVGLTSLLIWAANRWLGDGVLVFNAAKLGGLGLILIVKFFVFRQWIFVDRTAAEGVATSAGRP